MNNLFSEKDWSNTPLGPIKGWPQSLRTALNICLASDSPASICWGDDFIFIYNEAWKQFFGERHSSALGQSASDVLGVNWQIFKPNFEEVLKSGEIKKVRDKAISVADEKNQRSDISFSPIYNERGRTNGIFTIVKERVGFRRADSKLSSTEEGFYDFFEYAPIAIHWLGPEGTILKANQTELDMLGYSREEYVGRNISEFVVNEEVIKGVFEKLHKGEEIENYEVRLKHKDGSIREVIVSSNVLMKNGEFIHTRCLTRDITSRKQWEQRLEDSENRYRTLIENFPKGAVGLFDKDLKYTAVGGDLLSQVGVTPEDRIGNNITDIYPSDIVDDVKPYFEDVFKGEANSFEAELHNRHLFAQTLPIVSNGGEIISGMLVVQDVTERWQAKQELRESEAKFRMMAENLKEVIWMVSEDGEEFIYANPAFDKIWGVDRNKLYEDSRFFLNFIHPDDRDRVRNRFNNLPESEFEDEYRIIRPDGEVRWLYARGSKIYDEDSQITRIIGIAEDITKRKDAERQLRKSRNRLKAALDIETVGVIFWSGEDLIIKETNDAFLKMSGFSREEIVGKSWRELTPAEFHTVSKKAILEVEKTGHAEPYEKQYIHKDGTRFWGLFAPRHTDKNEAVEFVLDITDRKEAQKELEEINATLEQRVEKRTKKLRSYRDQLRRLASQLNKAEERERRRLATELHDKLGQILAVAKMKVEELRFGQISDHSFVLEELKEVVDDALIYSQNLMVELKPPPVLNKEDVTEVLLWTANQMKKQGLSISVEDDGKSKLVDEELRIILYQSVRELFQNVLKHADVKEARMEISRQKKHVKVTIEDKGKGFEISEIWLIPTEAGKFGLFNIKERMDLNGGDFEIHSVPDNGTKAVLYVPLKQEVKLDEETLHHQDSQLPSDPEGDHKQPKVKVLLVDDHQMMRRGLRQMIEKQEDMLIVGEASQGQEAVELACETMPDIIVMDVNMPVMNGIEATHIIKSKMPNIQIIGLSLHEGRDVIKSMQSAGASAYLTKNEAFESLVTTIRAESSRGNGT